MGKTIHIHVHTTRDAGEWEESKHPRAENGQFGKGSGGGTKPATKKSPHKNKAGFNQPSPDPKAKPAPIAGASATGQSFMPKVPLSAVKASNRQAELREMGSPRATGLRENPVKAHREQQAAASGGHQPGSHQYHQAKADEMRGMSRPDISEHANLQLTTLHHHQNAATALKRLETAQGTEYRRQLKEQADFHMKGAAKGEKQMQAAGLLKKPVKEDPDEELVSMPMKGSGPEKTFAIPKPPAGVKGGPEKGRGPVDLGNQRQDPPTSINHGGVKHTATGKSGKHLGSGEAMHEYEAVNAEGRRTGARVWRTVSGKVIPD